VVEEEERASINWRASLEAGMSGRLSAFRGSLTIKKRKFQMTLGLAPSAGSVAK
jgi:hypothetical protein